MKQLFYISIILLLSQVAKAQSPLEQRLDFDVKNMPLAEALIELGKTSNVPISFSDDILPKNKLITLRTYNQTVKYILSNMLKNTDVAFQVVGSQVVLFYKKRPKRNYTISGYIKDKTTGEGLIAANVFETKSRKGTYANEYGFFSLTLKEGENNLIISYTGYESSREKFNLEKNQSIQIFLNPTILSEVVVTPDEIIPEILSTQPLSENNFSAQDISQLPSLGGEVDLFRTAELMPGVQSGADGLGGLHVRGGSADQNLILMDGVPIYNPSHALGIFSVFNTEAIQSVKLSKGAFPARYGGRLSSVMDVRTREGNSKKWTGSVKAGLITSSARIEGPLIKDKSSILITARRTLLDGFIRNFSRKSKREDPYFLETFNMPLQGFSEYSFYDLNGKLNFSLGKKDKLFFSYYNGGDAFRDEDHIEGADFRELKYFDSEIQTYDWGNQIGVFRWNHIFGDKLFLNTTLTHSIFNFDVQESIEVDYVWKDPLRPANNFFNGRAYFSELKDWGVRLDFDYNTSKNHHLRFGLNSTLHTFEPGAFGGNQKLDGDILFEVDIDSFLNANQIRATEYNAYFEDEFFIGKKFKLNIGVLANLFFTESKSYFEPQPRLSVNYLISEKIQLQGAVSRMVQPMHLITSSDAGFPNDLWLPSTRLVRPQTSWQNVLGIKIQPNKKYSFSLEGYYKKLNNQVLFLNNTSLRTELSNPANFTFEPINAENWESQITIGEGWNYGLEFQAKKEIGKTKGWVSYTWAFANRRYNDLNNGEQFPYRFDRRHNLSISAVHRFTSWLDVTATWIYGSGLSTLIPTSTFQLGGITVINYSFTRMPANHRLDAGVNFYFKTKMLDHQFFLGAYNIYNRSNPQYYQIQTTPTENSSPSNPEFDFNVNQGSFLPFLPSVSYRISF